MEKVDIGIYKTNMELQDMDDEEWKPVIGHEELYHVSNMGRIKSFHGKAPKILSQPRYTVGYHFIALSKDGKKQQEGTARLVAKHFIPNPDNKREVNHKNGIKTDDRVENLEWATPSENQLHSYRVLNRCKVINPGIKGGKNKGAKPINQLTLEGKFLKKWDAMSEAAHYFNIAYTGILSCCIGNSFSAAGFKWEYANAADRERYFKKKSFFSRTTPILQFDAEENFLREFDSITSACRYTNCPRSSLCYALNGRAKQAHGFVWKYKFQKGEKIVRG